MGTEFAAAPATAPADPAGSAPARRSPGSASPSPTRSSPTPRSPARLGIDENWIVTRTGIDERRIAAPEQRLSELAALAAERALAAAGLAAADLDLLLVATTSNDDLMPGASPRVAAELGARRRRRSTSTRPAPASSPASPSPAARSSPAAPPTRCWSAPT